MSTNTKEVGADITDILTELERRLEAAPRTEPEAVERAARYNSPVHLNHVPQIICADGFKMSVQASGYHYCSPRTSFGPWDTVEIGFPSTRVDAFMPYVDGGETTDPTDTVYGYVPIHLVAEAIAAHGGFASPSPARSA